MSAGQFHTESRFRLQVLLQNKCRREFPSLLHGEEARFEASTYLDICGAKYIV